MRMINLSGPAPVTRLDKYALERLVDRYSRVHDNHEAPLVGCYLCLHDAPRERRQLRLAA
jgi:hypothetical protein